MEEAATGALREPAAVPMPNWISRDPQVAAAREIHKSSELWSYLLLRRSYRGHRAGGEKGCSAAPESMDIPFCEGARIREEKTREKMTGVGGEFN